MAAESEEQNVPLRNTRLSLVAIAIVAGMVLVGVMLPYRLEFGPDALHNRAYWGQFGDYVGGLLNPIFGFLGFLALLATLYYQRREYEEQRRFILKQQFEQTFFQLLHAFNEVLADVTYYYIGRRERTGADGTAAIETYDAFAKSRGAFSFYWDRTLKDWYEVLNVGTHGEKVLRTAESFYLTGREELGQYYRALYHIFKFIDLSHLSHADKASYANIARSQLSSLELSAIFYNGIVKEGEAGFKPLIEKYGILKHIESKHLLSAIANQRHPEGAQEDDKDRYAKTAFMKFSDRFKEWKGAEPKLQYD